MDSYFNLNGKLKSMQQKLASASKYIPKDLIKNVPASIKKAVNRHQAGTIEDHGSEEKKDDDDGFETVQYEDASNKSDSSPSSSSEQKPQSTLSKWGGLLMMKSSTSNNSDPNPSETKPSQ